MTITCSTCKIDQLAGRFNKCASHPSGRYTICKGCRSLATKKQLAKHGDKIRASNRAWLAANRERHRENARRSQRENWEYRKAYMRQWTKNNPGKANAHTAKRYAAKTQACPRWLTKEQRKQIQEIYVLAQDLQWLSEEPLHVDHIEPLRGNISCGLHVPWNLQIIAASANLAKSNRLEG